MKLLDTLRDLFDESESANPDELAQVHQKIYDYIDESIADKPLLSGWVPPVDIFIYAVNNIILPTLAINLLPDFLDLLTTIESYRLQALSKARKVLTWHVYYTQNPDNEIVALNTDEEAFLQHMVEEEHDNDDDEDLKVKGMRAVYIAILTKFCEIDLYHLWLADPLSITDYMVRYHEYFPFNASIEIESSYLFHKQIKAERELRAFHNASLKCSSLVRDTYLWADAHKQEGQSIRDMFQTQEFRETFPFPCDQEVLMDLVRDYMMEVKSSLEILSQMLSPPSTDITGAGPVKQEKT